MRDHNIAPVGPNTNSSGSGGDVVDIKCVVFRETCPGLGGRSSRPSIVAVVDQDRRVSISKLASCLGVVLGCDGDVQVKRQDVRMVERERLVEKVGFPAGEVPPFGFSRPDVVTIVDKELVARDVMVRFGPEDSRVVIEGEALLDGGGVAFDISCEGREVASSTADDRCRFGGVGNNYNNNNNHNDNDDDGLAAILPDGSGSMNEAGKEVVRFERIFRVVRKRKLAKRLLFATVMPFLQGGVSQAYGRNSRNSGSSLAWRHPETNAACELQLIIGKTLEGRYGKKQMEVMLKRVVKGGYVRVVGVVQPNAKNDSCVDVIVHDLETLGASSVAVMSRQPASTWETTDSREPFSRPEQQPYINLNTLKLKKKKKMVVSKDAMLPDYTPARRMAVETVRTMEDLQRLKLSIVSSSVVSLDAEWRPSTRQGKSNPVSLLQLGVCSSNDTETMQVFLIDMLELCFYKRDQSMEACLTREQLVLNEILEDLFAKPEVLKLGFGLRYDVKRMRESYPWLPCFQKQSNVCSHVDLGMLARLDGMIKSSKNLSLRKLAATALGLGLSKEEQLSDWGARPLTDRQIQYASNDVACLVDIYDVILRRHPDILSGPKAMDYVALSLWDLGTGTGDNLVGQGYSTLSNNNKNLGGSALELVRKQSAKKLPLKECSCDPVNGPVRAFLGEYVAKGGKVGCVEALIGLEESKKYNAVPRGGALIELENAFLVFVNVPSKVYPNSFEDGKMSWFSSRGQTFEHPVIRRLLNGTKSIHLWCRREKERYVYFGEMEIDHNAIHEQEDGALKIWYRLLDWPALSVSATVLHVLEANKSTP
jgi:prolyl-tRNA editing enzyme YbaK/EbsC (Cys-tRNA(Pro) deacylase)